MSFGPATQAWFDAAFAAPTPVQERGWDAIASGQHALLIAPTGSGKTLAAFLFCIDRLARAPAAEPGVRVLYVSPLKALVYDVERNLRAPLAGIARAARELGEDVAEPSVGVRTGDSSPRERRQLVSRPPDILVTTPESLYLMLGSRARDTLRTVDTIVVDEVHALAATKRGAHLALSLERLGALTEREPQRIGLSATARPLDAVARYLGGDRSVAIVDTSSRPALDLEIVVPVADMTRPELGATDAGAPSSVADAGERGMWPVIHPRLIDLIRAHTTTIVFVNSRGLCERLTRRINELAGETLCRSHHGSVSHAERRQIEGQLQAGELRALVATSSLELGIDMGAVDLVVLVESPGAVSRGLQRVGRAGHGVGQVSRGRIFPKHRGDLLEAAAIAARMIDGDIEPLRVLENPLDVLAQQIVAAVAMDDWQRDALAALFRRAAGFADLPESACAAVLDMLAGHHPSHDFARLTPRILWDRSTDVLSARRGAKMISLISGGTIPDRGTYGVFLAGSGSRVGELDEEMVHETQPGQVFTLGASSWRVEGITRDQVIVTPAPGDVGKLPFWHGEGPGRPVELGRALGALVRDLDARSPDDARRLLRDRHRLDDLACDNLLAYLAEQRDATGTLPTDRSITVERFRDELGDWRVCILSPFGSRVHAPWAMAIEARLSSAAGFEVQTMWSDDGIALRMGSADEPPDVSMLVPSPGEVRELVVQNLGGSALFASQFRENAARSLLMPRRSPGARTPLWVQRLKARELLAAARQVPSFPVVIETYRSCLEDVFDMPALIDILRGVEARELEIEGVETPSPSPFARSLAYAYVAAYLYEGDTPAAERRAHALSLDRKLLAELLGHDELRELLDAEIIAEVEAELQHRAADRKVGHADALHDLLRRVGDLDEDEVAERCAEPAADLLAALESSRRAVRVGVAGTERWIAIEDTGLYRDAVGATPRTPVPAAFLAPVPGAREELVTRHARSRGPFTSEDLARRYDWSTADADAVLVELERRQSVVGGAFHPGGDQREWCHTEVLRRIKRRTLARLRDEVAPVGGAVIARFLPAWHGLDRPGRGMARLREVITRLEGLPLSLRDLESFILPARVADFQPRMLDELGASGWLTWVGHGALGARDGRVALYRRDAIATLLDPPEPPDDLGELGRALVAALEARGASFLPALRDAVGASLEDTVKTLRELALLGLVTNDSLAPLRRRAPVRASAGRGRNRALSQAAGGRWSLVRELSRSDATATERAHARATKLLERHGVVCREVNEIEPATGGFSAVYAVLREMEDLGKVRRGYFIEGVGGAQFALPGAVDRLRSAAATDRKAVLLAATDPANPYGWLLPWPARDDDAGASPRRVAGAHLVVVDGEPVLYLAGKRLTTFAAAGEPTSLAAALARVVDVAGPGRRRTVRVDEIDGVRASRSSIAAALVAAGFRPTLSGFELGPG